MKSKPALAARPALKLADEVWLTLAMLHRSYPRSPDFSIDRIMAFARSVKDLRVLGPLRSGFYAHVVQHCVADRIPSPARYRMLAETAPGRRRLFRPGDPYNPLRDGGKVSPNVGDLPDDRFQALLDWYRDWSQVSTESRIASDPLLALYGSGKELWADEHADDYVRRIREGWE